MARFRALFQSFAIAALAIAFVGGAAVAASDDFTDAQKSNIEAVIKNYLLKNPEVLRDAINELENRQKAADDAARNKIIGNLQGPLYASSFNAIVGNPDGKVTLVEFFDYNCGYCKKMLPDIARLIKDNPDLRVVLRDYPILSDASVEAAQIAAAVRNQFKGEKFWEYHQRLLGMHGLVGKLQAVELAQAMGADMPKLVKDATAPGVKDGLDESDKLGRELQLNGTPSYVVGNDVVVGAVGYDDLKTKLDNVRKCGKVVCS